jgi:hypothetical protein
VGKVAKGTKARRRQAKTINVNMAGIRRKVVSLTPGDLVSVNSHIVTTNYKKSAEVVVGRQAEGPNNVVKL